LRRKDYPATATAAADSIALVWPMSAWDGLVAAHPALAVNAMRTIGSRLQEAQTRMRELATEAVERRVAHAVLRLANQAGKREEGGVRIDFPLSAHLHRLGGRRAHRGRPAEAQSVRSA
jgi:CRP-like cAMP-binding protein